MKKENKKTTKKEEVKEDIQQMAAPLQIHTQYIKDLSFEAPLMPFVGAEIKEAPKVDINVNINAKCANK